jgi:phosphoadenosine phosphosulfate reductase
VVAPPPVSTTPVSVGPPDLARVSEAFEQAHPAEVLRWAGERFGTDIVATISFEDPVLVHLVATALPEVPLVLLDTQYLFAETHWYAKHLQQRLGFQLEVVHPKVDPDDRWQTDVEGCCGVRKVEPLERVLKDRAAWITGVRRADGPTRANAPIVSWDARRNLVKLNPLATFTDEDMALYASLYELPPNPLSERGFASIGCWPCTRPVAPGEDKRAGRWSGHAKTECGLHV